MYFRFGCALVVVIIVSVAGIALEKRCLALRRAISRQHYRHDALADLYARLRLQTQQLGAPARVLDSLEKAATNPLGGEPEEDKAAPLVSAPHEDSASR